MAGHPGGDPGVERVEDPRHRHKSFPKRKEVRRTNERPADKLRASKATVSFIGLSGGSLTATFSKYGHCYTGSQDQEH